MGWRALKLEYKQLIIVDSELGRMRVETSWKIDSEMAMVAGVSSYGIGSHG